MGGDGSAVRRDVESRDVVVGGGIWVGVGLILVVACARAMSAVVPMPWWDLSPAFSPAMMKGYGPSGSILFDLVMLFGSVLVLVFGRGLMTRGCWLVLAAGVFGLLWAVLHAGWLAPGAGWPSGAVSVEDARLGSAWGSAMIAGAVMCAAARHPGVRACVLSVVIGFCVAIAVRGLVQVYVEHPATMRSFDASSFFAARGWDEDSPMARGYLRRIGQAEASGWFFLSNVAATYAAAGFVAAGSLLFVVLGARRRGGLGVDAVVLRPAVVVGVVGVVAGLVGLWLTGSKGGPGVVVLVCGVLAVCWMVGRNERLRRLAVFVGPMGVLAAVLAVVVRGMVGERIGELSLLFRWFYFVGSARIFGGEPVFGVGPDGFREAFLLAKPPLCPEDVSDPHNVFLMFVCALGVAGLAWSAVLVWWASRAGVGAVLEKGDAGVSVGDGDGELAWRVAGLVAACSTLLAAAVERGGATSPSDALVRVVVLGLWVWVAVLVVRRGWWSSVWGERAVRLGLAGAGLVVLVHSQIEMTLTWGSSVSLGMVVLGAAAGGGVVGGGRVGCRRVSGFVGGGVVFAAGVVVGVVLWRPVDLWQGELKAGAFVFKPSASLESELRVAVGMLDRGARRARLEEIAGEAGGLMREAGVRVEGLRGFDVPTQPSAIAAVLAGLRSTATDEVASHLERALRYGVRRGAVRRELSQVLLAEAVASAEVGGGASLTRVREYADRAVLVYVPAGFAGGVEEWSPADEEVSLWPATGWGWLATVYEVRSRLFGEDRRAAELGRSVEALEQATGADPFNPHLMMRLALVYERLGRAERAGVVAGLALKLEELGRLDAEVRGFSDSDRARLRRLEGSGL